MKKAPVVRMVRMVRKPRRVPRVPDVADYTADYSMKALPSQMARELAILSQRLDDVTLRVMMLEGRHVMRLATNRTPRKKRT